ncbi:TPA: hypothetical protein ACNCG9_004786, partial [Escherichia coli]
VVLFVHQKNEIVQNKVHWPEIVKFAFSYSYYFSLVMHIFVNHAVHYFIDIEQIRNNISIKNKCHYTLPLSPSYLPYPDVS